MYDRALLAIAPGTSWDLRAADITWIKDEQGNDIPDPAVFTWHSTTPMPTKAELEAEVARQWELHHATMYKKDRSTKYPPLQVLADALYWQSKGDNTKLEAYIAACDAVKEQFPKP
jgi:hypothetical protein